MPLNVDPIRHPSDMRAFRLAFFWSLLLLLEREYAIYFVCVWAVGCGFAALVRPAFKPLKTRIGASNRVIRGARARDPYDSTC